MKFAIMGAVLAATVLTALPASAEVVIRAGEGGVAVGMATAQPGTIARIAEWAAKIEKRGFVLVPISMVAVKAKSS